MFILNKGYSKDLFGLKHNDARKGGLKASYLKKLSYQTIQFFNVNWNI